jgi:GAF domain-containing protein
MARLSATGGRASKEKARRANQAKDRKTARTSPNDKQRQNPERETEVARLKRELKEALEQQKASANILSVISNSAADPKPVFDKILGSIEHLFGGQERFIFQVGEDGLLHLAASHGPNVERLRALFPIPVEGTANEQAIRERRLVRYADVLNDPGVPPGLRETARRFGRNYSMVVAPMLWENRAIGTVFVGRTTMEAFSDKECGLLGTFADQAVIAIQNARMFNEVQAKSRDLSEALQQQTATAEVLKAISRSASGPRRHARYRQLLLSYAILTYRFRQRPQYDDPRLALLV